MNCALVIKVFREKRHEKYCPPRGRPSSFHHGRHYPGLFRPLMTMSKESFMEMREYFILKILSDNMEGITGYQLQEEYQFPRTNVLRLLEKLVEANLVETKEETIEGRANKLYIITNSGIKKMEEMKERWGERFRMMSETTMPFFTPGEKFLFIRRLNEFENSEDAIDYFRGFRSKIKSRQTHLEERIKIFKNIRKEVDTLIEILEKDKEFDKEKLRKHVEDWWERQRKEGEE